MTYLRVLLPVKIESSLNMREHWRKRANRNTSHRAEAFFGLKQTCPKFNPAILPCVVTLTRIAPRELDDDNLAGGFKSVRDGVADWLGIDDRDPRVKWAYAQKRGEPRQYAAMVEIAALPAHTDHPLRHFDRTCAGCLADAGIEVREC